MNRMTTLFRVGAGLLALHVADDTMIQPPAGTTWTDHLASGLIPIGLLVIAATVYPRLRSSARGLLTLTVGALALIAGVEAIYYSLEVGPSGDDFTGLLVIPAGLGLLGLGAVTLYRARSLNQSRPIRYGKRALMTVAALVVVDLVLFPTAFGYLTTHISRAGVPEADLGTAYEDVAFTTEDGLELEGWYVPSRNGAAVIVFPGRAGTQKQAALFANHDYGVLLFDRRGEGASEGAPNGFGWGGELDIEAAIAYLRSRDDVEPNRIAGVGQSVGGELMLQVAAEDDDGLSAVVSEGAGARSYAEESREVHGLKNVDGTPFLLAKTASVALFSDTAPPPSLFDLIPRIAPTPLLLISAADAPNETLAPRYAALGGEGSTHWAVPGANHIGAITGRPAEYERTVVSFLDDALAVGR